MQKITLSNGVEIPAMAIGTNRMNFDMMFKVISGAFDAGLNWIDTARDYGNEHIVGEVLKKVCKKRGLQRKDFYLTTKVGNSQQFGKNMYAQIDISLKKLRTDYIDLWLLHWPYPGYYIDNYRQMEKICQSGKVRAIGVANCRVRHITEIRPMVIQIEHHPFRQSKDILNFCTQNNIQVQAYSPLLFMIDKLKYNETLKSLAKKHNKSLGQIVLKWHCQHNVIPVFRSENPLRFKENSNIFDFALDSDDMKAIELLDEDYKFIPESLHCPGY